MNKYKIGEAISFSEDFEIESALGGNKLQVKAGDKGYIDSRCSVHYTSGQARGKIQSLGKEIEVNGYDHENISKMIFRRIKNEFGLAEHLEGYEISDKNVIEVIEDILSDIL